MGNDCLVKQSFVSILECAEEDISLYVGLFPTKILHDTNLLSLLWEDTVRKQPFKSVTSALIGRKRGRLVQAVIAKKVISTRIVFGVHDY